MTKEEYSALTARAFEARVNLSRAKQIEYTFNDNPFDNFDRQACDIEVSPLVIWRVYAAKHWDSITSYIVNPSRESTEPIESRIDDLQNYLDLLRGMICRDELRMTGDKTPESSSLGRRREDGKNFRGGLSSDPAGTSSRDGGEKLG